MNRILFDVPKWHVYLHRSGRQMKSAEHDDSARLRFEDELFDRLYVGEPEALPEEQKSQELRSWAERIHSACDQLPAFQRLVEECRGDSDAAASAVEEVVGQLGQVLKQEPEKVDAPALRRALGAGCEKGSAAVGAQREAAEALAGVGWGASPGQPGASTPGAAKGLAARLKKDARLRRIAELAGRFRRIAHAKQRSKVRHGHDEIADIELGADVGRLLPSEMCRLLRPAQRLALYRDLAERRCLQYQLRGAEPLGKGPLVVLLDKSGSMEGEKDVWATAVALALLDIAQRQKRLFALLAFESMVRFEATVEPGGELAQDALFVGCGGGTDIATAMRRALKVIEDKPGAMKKADVVLITDGWSDSDQSGPIRDKAAELGVTTLGVGIGVDEEVLRPWSSQSVGISRLDALEEKAAEQLLSI